MRQWIRHRIGSFNEISGRYAKMADDFYIPEHFRAPVKGNKQSSQSANLAHDELRNKLIESQKAAYTYYQQLLDKQDN